MSAPVAILAIGDTKFRERMRTTLVDLRWRVLEACGGVDTLAHLRPEISSTVVMDAWFPDLEIQEFVREVESSFPCVDLISTDGIFEKPAKFRNSRNGEILYALRVNQGARKPDATQPRRTDCDPIQVRSSLGLGCSTTKTLNNEVERGKDVTDRHVSKGPALLPAVPDKISREAESTSLHLSSASLMPEFVGTHPLILEMCRRIRLVAERETPVLIQGASGTGKELVARALHRLSLRKNRPFIAVNCAAIPDSLLESELFGHTKGSFTGAVQNRVGRIEAAAGGTLFLDEIGEIPLALQAKLLRFLESGEIQRIGDNEAKLVDARVVAASNQHLGLLSTNGAFRADLFYRLAVFLIETPPLSMHIDDLPALAEFFLAKLLIRPEHARISALAMAKMQGHSWPGNVRELAHVVERAFILSDSQREITDHEIEFASLIERS